MRVCVGQCGLHTCMCVCVPVYECKWACMRACSRWGKQLGVCLHRCGSTSSMDGCVSDCTWLFDWLLWTTSTTVSLTDTILMRKLSSTITGIEFNASHAFLIPSFSASVSFSVFAFKLKSLQSCIQIEQAAVLSPVYVPQLVNSHFIST